jgi:hypothetical protein
MIGLKYLFWILSTSLAFVGAWLCDFTKPDPTAPQRRLLTKAGRVALPFAVLGFAVSLTLEIHDDDTKRQEAATLKRDRTELTQKLDNANAEITKLAHPLRSLRVICYITYKDVSSYWPVYARRVIPALGSTPIQTIQSSSGSPLLPREQEHAGQLLNGDVTVAFKHPRKGTVVFNVLPSPFRPVTNVTSDTGWNLPNTLLDYRRVGKNLSIVRQMWSPAVLFRNDPRITSSDDLIDPTATAIIEVTIYHSGVLEKYVSVDTIHISLPGREHVITLTPALCTPDSLGDRTILTCRRYEIDHKKM